MRDKTGCPAETCYGDVEPNTKHCSWNLCPLDALEGNKRRHAGSTLRYQMSIADTSAIEARVTAWAYARALVAARLREFADWIEP